MIQLTASVLFLFLSFFLTDAALAQGYGQVIKRGAFTQLRRNVWPVKGLRTRSKLEAEAMAKQRLQNLREELQLSEELTFSEPELLRFGQGFCFRFRQTLEDKGNGRPRWNEIVGTEAKICFDASGHFLQEMVGVCNDACRENSLPLSPLTRDEVLNLAQGEMFSELREEFGSVIDEGSAEVKKVWLNVAPEAETPSLRSGYEVTLRTERHGLRRQGALPISNLDIDERLSRLLEEERKKFPRFAQALDAYLSLELDKPLEGRFVAYLSADGELISYGDKVFTAGYAPWATVYHRDPKTSSLKDRELTNLLQPLAALQSSFFYVDNAIEGMPNAKWRQGEEYRYDLHDTHFNETQAYYGLNYGIDKFVSWGYRPPQGRQELDSWVIPVVVHYWEREGVPYNNAFYDGTKIALGDGDGVNLLDLAKDNTVVIHEYGHFLVDRFAHIVFHRRYGDGGAIHEGFADYVACSAYDKPTLGEGVMPDGQPMRPCDLGRIDFNIKDHPDPHIGGLVLSAALWELRNRVGSFVVDQLVMNSLARIIPTGPGGTTEMVDIYPALLDAEWALFRGIFKEDIKEVLQARGFLG